MPARKTTRRHRAGRNARPLEPAVAAAHLLPRSELERIAERIFRLSEADETEVSIEVHTDALTRFANNVIHQNVAEQSLVISVRTVLDGRTARASTNRTEEEALAAVVRASLALARVQPPHPDLLPMPGRQKIPRVDHFDAATAQMGPLERAQAVAQVTRLAAGRGQLAAGIFATGAFQTAIINSRGLFASYEQTRAEFSVTMLDQDASGWAKANFPRAAQLAPEELAERASQKARGGRQRVELSPGRYVVVLEPAAVLDLVGFLFYDFSATAVADQRSCFTDRLGQPLFSEKITIWDNVYHPLQTGPPFDGEGIPRQRVLLVERGVPRALVYSRQSAHRLGAQPTGHGLPLPNEWGEAPVNLVFEGGDRSLEDLVASTDRGILVTRFWYIREVDPYQKILTGMTRDGTFLIEGGKPVAAVKNFRFNQSILEMLAAVEALGPAVRAAGEESFEMVVPAMKARDFHFTELTRF